MLVLGEHQSTVNPNMPLRCLMYVGRAYEQLVEKKARYRTTQVKIRRSSIPFITARKSSHWRRSCGCPMPFWTRPAEIPRS